MTLEQASKLLKEMYDEAPDKEKVLFIHLFAIEYADQIEDMSAKDIVVGADLPESYKTEIRKGINLAKYVQLRVKLKI